ncbi:MAG: hypothetical protein K8R54_12160 [Bacteroidales bacterium]|nr:hypothetical protein [Bacteroidales bacterium]
MKIKKSIQVLTVLASLLFFSDCKKDIEDEEEVKINQIEYNGEIYDLSWGIIDYDGSSGELHYFSISLYSKTINYDSNSGKSGTGHEFWFEDIISASNDVQGTYNAVEWLENTVEEAGIIGECEMSERRTHPDGDENDIPYHEFYDGELSITKVENNYTITFNGKDPRGVDISLYYKGSLIDQ